MLILPPFLTLGDEMQKKHPVWVLYYWPAMLTAWQ